jgi:hypothetical protein
MFFSLFIVLSLVLTGCSHSGAASMPWNQSAPPAGMILTDLHDFRELQARFSQDAGKPRLLLLVSPT